MAGVIALYVIAVTGVAVGCIIDRYAKRGRK